MRRLLAALAFAAVAAGAHAQPIQPFSMASLKAAQAQGRPILVDVHADWCPTCRAQDPTLKALSADPAYAKLVILKLDFDTQTQDWRALGVRQQSTLIAFSGTRETGRLVGVTDPSQIKALASAALH